jgi:hypothetical protein
MLYQFKSAGKRNHKPLKEFLGAGSDLSSKSKAAIEKLPSLILKSQAVNISPTTNGLDIMLPMASICAS